MNNYRILPGLLATTVLACAFQAQAATKTTVIDGANSSMGVAGNGCLQSLLNGVSEGENCMYGGGPNRYEFPAGSGSYPWEPIGESIGPTNQLQYYDYGVTPLAFDDPSTFVPTNGDGKIRRVINGSITIDDQGNGFGADDEISFTFTLTSPLGGDIVRNEATGWVDKFTSMTQVLAPTVPHFATANASGGFDYVIASAGFPLLLTFTDASADETSAGAGDGPCVGQTFGDMECGAGFDTNQFTDPLRWRFYDDGSMPPLTTCSEPGINTAPPEPCWRPNDLTTFFGAATIPPPGQFDVPHVGPAGSPGLGTMESNFGVRTSGSLGGTLTCNDTGTPAGTSGCTDSKVSFNPLINAPAGAQTFPEDVDWDQVYLKVSTDAQGNVLTAEGFDLQETQIFTAALACGSDPGKVFNECVGWSGGHFVITGVVAADDTAETAVDTAVDIDVLANDTGFVDDVTVTLPGGGTSANGGTVLVNGTNPGPQGGIDITYTPPAGVGGAGTDTFDYTINDGTNSGTATVTVDVLLGANDDMDSTRLNVPITIEVGLNDGGFADPVTVMVTVLPDMGGTIDAINGSPGPAGSVTIDYTPVAALGSTATYTETFTYEVDDGVSPPDTAVVTVTVMNELPVAVDTDESVASAGQVTTDVALLAGVNLGDAPSTVAVTANPGGGVATVTGTEITYTSNGVFAGSDSYDYTITDMDGETSTATVTVLVGPAQPPGAVGPTANVDLAAVDQAGSVEIDVTANDEPGAGAIEDHTVEITSEPSSGTTSLDDATNIVTYRPESGFFGLDGFEYTLTDEDDNSSTTTVAVQVNKQTVSLPTASAIGPWSLALLVLVPWLRQRRKII